MNKRVATLFVLLVFACLRTGWNAIAAQAQVRQQRAAPSAGLALRVGGAVAGLPERAAPAEPAGSVIYVDHRARGANDGSSWSDAYPSLQVALTEAVSGAELWVAAGIYHPSTQRLDSFQLKNNVA